jgi:hypothetical protein
VAQAAAFSFMNALCAEVEREVSDLALKASVAPPERAEELIAKITQEVAHCTNSYGAE